MITINPLNKSNKMWAYKLLEQQWGKPGIITRGKLHDTTQLSGFVTIENEDPIGLITYTIERNECEIISLNSLQEGRGIGSSLIDEVASEAKNNGCYRMVIITTNDNINALHFYQKRGFHISAIYPNALETSRKLKPTIPLIGIDGIPLRDEIELEKIL